MQDIIRLVPNTAPAVGSTYNNTGKQHGSGMELETVWDAGSKLRLTGSYSFQESIDDATGQDAGYSPRHRIYLRTDWRYASGWFASAQLNRVMDRRRTAGDTRPRVPDYTTVDLSPSKGSRDFSTSVRNLFNADVREPTAPLLIPNDLPMAPRSLWKALPAERYGSASAIHARFLEWEKAGVFEALWKLGLAEYDELEGIAWRWQSIDGAMMEAPLAQESVGPNPADWGKKWEQTPFAGGRPWCPIVARRDRSQSA